MKRISILLLILFACLVSAAWPQAQVPTPQHSVNRRILPFPHRPGFPQIPQLPQRVEPAILPAALSPDVVPVPCPPDAQAWGAAECGTLAVPLDRERPRQGTINIYFELYVHYVRGQAESALLANPGLPGLATSGVRDLLLGAFSPLLDVHDILLIDDRGRGFSGTIVCNEAGGPRF